MFEKDPENLSVLSLPALFLALDQLGACELNKIELTLYC